VPLPSPPPHTPTRLPPPPPPPGRASARRASEHAGTGPSERGPGSFMPPPTPPRGHHVHDVDGPPAASARIELMQHFLSDVQELNTQPALRRHRCLITCARTSSQLPTDKRTSAPARTHTQGAPAPPPPHTPTVDSPLPGNVANRALLTLST
jgi:hypothetical protein